MSTRFAHQSQRREFVQVNTDVPVRYRFLSKVQGMELDQIFEGTTRDLGGGGCLLHGKVPDVTWVPELLMGRIHLGINLLLPSAGEAIKALCRVTWVEAFEQGTTRMTLGLEFQDIPKESQDQILRYLIKAQMTK